MDGIGRLVVTGRSRNLIAAAGYSSTRMSELKASHEVEWMATWESDIEDHNLADVTR